MTRPDTHSASHEPVDAAAFAEYELHDPREIERIMQTLIERSNLVRAYIDDRTSFLTVLLGLGPDRRSVVLDLSPDVAINERAQRGSGLVCVTRLDGVKIQFPLHPVTQASFRDHPALMAPLPERMLRLQRREFFRVPAPQMEPLICTILDRQADGRIHSITVRVLDLSGGGVAVVVPPDEIRFRPGDEFERSTLALPDGEPIPVRLCVRNLFVVEKENGQRLKRAGCQFVGLSNAASARIQRYLFKLERDYRARSAD